MRLLNTLKAVSPISQKFAESAGYYERVPIRVGEFTLEQNTEGKIVFETTSQKFCDDGPKVILTISDDNGGWSVKKSQGCYNTSITPTVDLNDERLARRRAMWHAAQYMSKNMLSYKERYTLTHQVHSGDDARLFADDAFFRGGNAVTNDPFGKFLEDK